MSHINLNVGALLSAAEEAVKTPAAKAEANKAYKEYIFGLKPGSLVSTDGKIIPTIAQTKAIANEFKGILLSHAAGVPGSVMAALASTVIEGPAVAETGDGFTIRYNISIPGNLERASWYPDGYDGINNIAALFDTGYTASHHVYGIIDGKRVPSRIHRDAMNYLQSAADDFNARYGSTYNMTITVGW